MDRDGQKVVYPELSYKIIGILFEVYNQLGFGYHEKIYQRAIAEALKENNLKFQRELPVKLKFKDNRIGLLFLDFLVDDKIILEIKKGNYFSKKNIEQVFSYLKAMGLKLAILVNFTSSGIKFRRILNVK